MRAVNQNGVTIALRDVRENDIAPAQSFERIKFLGDVRIIYGKLSHLRALGRLLVQVSIDDPELALGLPSPIL